jgi:hypothetical protein
MANIPPTASKIGASIGRERLKSEKFSPGPSTGARGECWLNKHQHPFFISYFGTNTDYFSLESLEIALAGSDATIM